MQRITLPILHGLLVFWPRQLLRCAIGDQPENFSIVPYVDQQNDQVLVFGLCLVDFDGDFDVENDDQHRERHLVAIEGRLAESTGVIEVRNVHHLGNPFEKASKSKYEGESEVKEQSRITATSSLNPLLPPCDAMRCYEERVAARHPDSRIARAKVGGDRTRRQGETPRCRSRTRRKRARELLGTCL